jgi:hypothetical protein
MNWVKSAYSDQQSPIIFMKFVYSDHQSTIINHQSPINNRWGGGAIISSFSGVKVLGHKETFLEYRQS